MSNFIMMQNDRGLGAAAGMSLTATVQQFPIGYTALAEDRQTGAGVSGRSNGLGIGEFVYCQGNNVTALGQFVHINNNSALVLAAANSASFFPVGLAAGNLSATNVFGWVQIAGLADYAKGTNSAIAAGVPLYVAAGTAGFLVTNVVAGNHVQGVVAPASYTSSQSNSLTVQLFRPFLAGLTASL